MTTYDEPTLFDTAITRGTHRQRDPATSIAAAKSVIPGPDQQRCLDALRRNGGEGTVDTVCDYFFTLGIRRDRGALSRRLTDLEKGELIAKTDRSVIGTRGKAVTVWQVVR